MARPRLSIEALRRKPSLCISLTDEELRIATEAAEEKNVSRSEFVRQALLMHPGYQRIALAIIGETDGQD